MRVLLIGYGSIAKKHIKALRQLRPNTDIIALRSNVSADSVEGITNVYNYDTVENIDFIMICNPTNLHLDTLLQVIKFGKPIFLEKPPFHTTKDIDRIIEIVKAKDIPVYTAFNLRFFGCIQYLKENIEINKVQEVNVYCGSYLPDWRPGQNYKEVYSANESMGGGVHLDLIHELDYTLWIFGQPNLTNVLVRRESSLQIDAIDYAHYTLIYNSFVTNITLNYYRKDPKRTIEIVTEKNTILCDLITNKVSDLTNDKLLYSSQQNVLDTYYLQMEYFLDLVATNGVYFNNLSESTQTLKIALNS